MIYRAIIIFLLLLGQINARAQKETDDRIDTLSTSELAEIVNVTRSSTFYYFWLADSCSKVNDSLNAGLALLKINPYQFMFERVTPDCIGAYISNHFRVTENVNRKYSQSFTEIYNKPQSPAYKKFKAMAEEDQAVRNKQEQCTDSACYSLTGIEMRHTDSVHFAYCYRYVMKNGWPSLADGSLPASLLAIHDHAHHEQYIPMLKKAVKEGIAELGALQLILYWYTNSKITKDIPHYLATHKHKLFPVNSMLNNEMPESITPIVQFIQDHCPVKCFYICECHDYKVENDWTDEVFSRKEENNVLGLLLKRLVRYNCNLAPDRLRSMQDGLWFCQWLPSDHKEMQLSLCVLYGRDDTVNFSKLLADKKFATHAINFEAGKASLKPESIDFIKQLAEWLKQNPAIRLEIGGHTDSDGDSVANIKLSLDRANEVKKQLASKGIDAKRLTTKGYGDTKPIKPNTTPEGKAENRRVEFIKL